MNKSFIELNDLDQWFLIQDWFDKLPAEQKQTCLDILNYRFDNERILKERKQNG